MYALFQDDGGSGWGRVHQRVRVLFRHVGHTTGQAAAPADVITAMAAWETERGRGRGRRRGEDGGGGGWVRMGGEGEGGWEIYIHVHVQCVLKKGIKIFDGVQ